MSSIVVAVRTFRIGKQTLLHSTDNRWFMQIENRTYRSTIEVPVSRVPLWIEALR